MTHIQKRDSGRHFPIETPNSDMKKYAFPPLAHLLMTAFMVMPLTAATIVNETFDPSGFSEYGGGNTNLNPNSGSWYRMSLSDSGFTVTDPGGELRMDASANFGSNFEFAGTTLANTGDSISLTFDGTYNGASVNSYSIRFGLFETGGITSNGPITAPPVDGIAAQIGATTGTLGRYGVMNDNTGFSSAPDSFTGSWNASATSTTQQFGYTITRNASDGLDLAFTLGGSTVTGSEVTIASGDVPTYSFDTVAFFVVNSGAASNEFLVDNVLVTTIPEPSSLLLMGAALAAVYVSKRRKR